MIGADAIDVTRPRAFVTMGQVEAFKWLALALMLVEHWFLFVFDAVPPWAYVAGRVVFPLFVVALALGLAAQPWSKVRGVMLRLFMWAFVAQLAMTVVDRDPGLNVLFTFGLGVLLHYAIACSGSVWRTLLAVLVVLVVGSVVEFGLWGVGFVCAVLALARADWRSVPGWIAAGLGLICLAVPNSGWYALLILPVLACLLVMPFELPRLRGAFYWAYAIQFPAFAAARMLLS